jgi:hypothetical protein
MMNLCQVYESIDFLSLDPHGHKAVTYHESYKDLQVSAWFCQLCTIFLSRLDNVEPVTTFSSRLYKAQLFGSGGWDGLYTVRACCQGREVLFLLFCTKGIIIFPLLSEMYIQSIGFNKIAKFPGPRGFTDRLSYPILQVGRASSLPVTGEADGSLQ